MSVYLDLDPGEVIHVTADVREELEAIYAELPEEQTDAEANKAAYARASCACRNAIRTKAPWICRRSSSPSHTHAWRSGSGLQFGVAAPSAASKDVLAVYPDERVRWFAFKAARVRQRV